MFDKMFDKYELPPPTRVSIPRVRNGDILVVEWDDRARLLGILAIMIAEATNPVVHDLVRMNTQNREMFTDPTYGIEPLPVDQNSVQVNYAGLDDLLEVMTMILEYDIDTALVMIAAKVDQQQADRGYISHELSIFADFVDNLPS